MEHPLITRALFPGAVKIGGVSLMPPTLGQWLMLEAAGSPFAVGGDASPSDARVALAVLSAPWRESRRAAMAGELAVWAAAKAPKASRRDVADISEWFGLVWAMPEQYREDGAADGPGWEPCVGAAYRYAVRATRLNLTALTLRRVESVWDLTVPEVLVGCVAAAELDGAEFESAEDTEISTRTTTSPPDGGKNQS